MTRNWEAIGLRWESSTVHEQIGDHATDRRAINVTAQLPIVFDIDKAAAGGIDILAWVNSANSPRVMAQDIARKSPGEKDLEKIREKVFNRLCGVRNVGGRTVVKEIKVRVLPNGVAGPEDEDEFRSAYAAALVDLGVNGEQALASAIAYNW